MRTWVFILPALIVFSGCSTSIKSTWVDFRSYYNTYYNAKEYYNDGIRKVEEQQSGIDPEEYWVRVFPAPVDAGVEDFEAAAETAASLLSRFPDSKWVDETLGLIGRSYYHLSDYYAALERFEDQYEFTDDPVLRQEATIWKARTLLELDQHSEGKLFLQEELEAGEYQWDPTNFAAAKILLAEHHIRLDELEEAASVLRETISQIQNRELKGKSYFLYGQLMETLGEYGEAYFAFNTVVTEYPSFEYLYYSELKRAEMAMNQRNYKLARRQLQAMERDDKYVERRTEIWYRLARLEEEEGNTDRAETIYNRILRDTGNSVDRELIPDTYFRLGRIYSDQKNRYNMAAAYFDSATVSRPGEGEDTRAYARYTDLKNELARQDSLLWLGTLDEAALDSVISRIREQSDGGRMESTLLNVSVESTDEDLQEQADRYGFLNINNPPMLAEARRGFRAIWGERPLVDNWRRVDAIRIISQEDSNSPSSQEGGGQGAGGTGEEAPVDLSEIPFTEEDRRLVLNRKGTLTYELGQHFFLSMNRPDSASHYFTRVIEQYPDHSLRPQAMYALMELNIEQDDTSEARRWADRLMDEFPDSRYARRAAERFELTEPEQIQTLEQEQVFMRQYRMLLDSLKTADSLRADNYADSLRRLALANRSVEGAASAHYRSLRHYVDQAKKSIDEDLYRRYRSGKETERPEIPLDSIEIYPLSGDYWDSVRVMADEHLLFPESPHQKSVEALQELFEYPEERSEEEAEVATCIEMDLQPKIIPDRQMFLDSVSYPAGVQDMELSGEITFEFLINTEGEVASYELIGSRSGLGIEEAFEEAIESGLRFEPVTRGGEPIALRCTLSFPLELR